jgi:hypothetical protein
MRNKRKNDIARMPSTVMKTKSRLVGTIKPRKGAETTASFGVSNTIRRKDRSRKSGGVQSFNHLIAKRIGEGGKTKIANSFRRMSSCVSNTEQRDRRGGVEEGNMPKKREKMGSIGHGTTIHMSAGAKGKGILSITGIKIFIEGRTCESSGTKMKIETMQGIDVLESRRRQRRRRISGRIGGYRRWEDNRGSVTEKMMRVKRITIINDRVGRNGESWRGRWGVMGSIKDGIQATNNDKIIRLERGRGFRFRTDKASGSKEGVKSLGKLNLSKIEKGQGESSRRWRAIARKRKSRWQA